MALEFNVNSTAEPVLTNKTITYHQNFRLEFKGPSGIYNIESHTHTHAHLLATIPLK